ncbi:MAG: CarD family transcriptional regulator [Candidatus Pelagibacter sp.]
MKKINLKNILKKTFKKNISKNKTIKTKIKKKIKNKKEKKILKNPKNKKVQLKKKLIKKIPEKSTNPNLRILKQNEQKPEIKKIKKQETEKKEFKIKDYVVYPKHGVGQILSINNKTIGGIEVQCYDIKFEKDKAVGLLPINKQSHLRPLSTVNQVNKSISILKGKPKIKRSMWSRRAQEYEQKITSGKIYDLAEVVRDLNKGDDLMVDQSYSERQLFEKAYERILSEFQIVLNLSFEDIQKKLNKALKRNLENQTQISPQPVKQIQNETSDDASETNNQEAGVGLEEQNP